METTHIDAQQNKAITEYEVRLCVQRVGVELQRISRLQPLILRPTVSDKYGANSLI